MTGEIEEPGDKDQVETEAEEDSSEENIELTADDVIVDESIADTRVEALVADIDSVDAGESAHKRETRKKLDALNEQRDDEFGSTYDFDLDDDL